MTLADWLLFFLGTGIGTIAVMVLASVARYEMVDPVFPWPWKRTLAIGAASVAANVLVNMLTISPLAEGLFTGILTMAATFLASGLQKETE